MAVDEIHYGDVGTVLTFTVYEGTNIRDISGASTKQVKFRKPSGAVATETAEFVTDGTDGKVKYTTVADDLNETGQWKAQVKIITASTTNHSDTTLFYVYPNIA